MLNVKTGINLLYATLSERGGVASLVYSMKIIPTEAKTNAKTITLTDLTNVGDRVNKLQMTIVPDVNQEDFPIGKVFLNGGDYIYEIYNQLGDLIEKGMLKFDTTLNQTTYSQNNVIETVYNGE